MDKVAAIITEHVCTDCGGSGEIVGYSNVEHGPMHVTVWQCIECEGTGKVKA